MQGLRQKQDSVSSNNTNQYNSPKLEPLTWRIKSNTQTSQSNSTTNSPQINPIRNPAQSLSINKNNKFTSANTNSPILKPSPQTYKVEWIPKKDLLYKQTEQEKLQKSEECLQFLKTHSQQKLQHEWSFWYSPRGKNGNQTSIEDYYKQQKPIAECDTADNFISTYSEINKPSKIPTDNKLMFFRKGCRPLWEDYPEGGCWLMMLKKRETEQLDKYWEILLLSCVEEYFGSQTIGVIISLRQKKNLIEIWVKNKEEKNRIILGEQICTKLNLDPTKAIFYFKDHIQSLQSGSTLRGAQGYVFVQSPTFSNQSECDQIKEDEELRQEVSNFTLDS